MASKRTKANLMNYEALLQSDVPQSRRGKHHALMTRILNDLSQLQSREAIKIPLDTLGDSKENVRSALNRISRKRGLHLVTASNDTYLYVWQEQETEQKKKAA